MQKVIVNSTPMIILSKIGLIDILQKLFGEIIIPQAVYNEITTKSDTACRIIKEKTWIKIYTITSKEDKRMYKSKLHDGEVEVMILAREIGQNVLTIIDDNAAKKTAKYLGLDVTGTLGVLILGKKKGYITDIKAVIKLMKYNGFYIGEKLEQQIIKASKEM